MNIIDYSAVLNSSATHEKQPKSNSNCVKNLDKYNWSFLIRLECFKFNVLYSCYMKFYFCYIFHIHVICFNIYLLYSCMYMIFGFAIYFYFHIMRFQICVITFYFHYKYKIVIMHNIHTRKKLFIF